jgi:hypothetical protein
VDLCPILLSIIRIGHVKKFIIYITFPLFIIFHHVTTIVDKSAKPSDILEKIGSLSRNLDDTLLTIYLNNVPQVKPRSGGDGKIL